MEDFKMKKCEQIILDIIGEWPPRDEMEQWLGDAVERGQIDPADFAALPEAEVRRLFCIAFAYTMNNPETPPAGKIRADLFAMDKRRQWHADETPMGDLGAAYAADYARQHGRVSECCDAPVVFNNATGDHVCGLCRDRVEV